MHENYSDPEIINIGTGYDISIKELTEVIAEVVGYNGDIKWDTTKPNGTPRKVMNVDKLLGLGWNHKVDIVEGLTKTYEWFKRIMIGFNALGNWVDLVIRCSSMHFVALLQKNGYNFMIPPSRVYEKMDEWTQHQLFYPFNMSTIENLNVQYTDGNDQL